MVDGQKWTSYHISVFILTFTGYAFFHATRKTFSNVKKTIEDEWTPAICNDTGQYVQPHSIWSTHHLFANEDKAEYFLGTLDTLFLFSYAIGLYISGIIGDRYDMRKVLAIGMCSSAVTVFLFGTVSQWLHIYSIAWYVVFWTLNGFLQSSGWPAMVSVMANWFGRSSRGLVMGLWASCASVGNIIGALIVSQVLKYGYEYAFLVPSVMLFGGGIIIFFGLVPHPNEVGLPSPDEGIPDPGRGGASDAEPLLNTDRESINTPGMGEQEEEEEEQDHTTDVEVVSERPQAMSFLQALKIQGVALYALSYACLKLVNYAFFFWLPFYLTNKFGWSQDVADEISIWYDVGGIISGFIAGFITDRLKIRSPVMVLLLIGAFPALYGYSVSPDNKRTNAILMAVTGFFIGGPANIISSAISADLGRQGSLQGNAEGLATVTGIIDGTGSVGGALGQILVPVIQLHLGWHAVFYMFMIMTFLTILCIAPIVVHEVREKMSQWGRPVRWPWSRSCDTDDSILS